MEKEIQELEQAMEQTHWHLEGARGKTDGSSSLQSHCPLATRRATTGKCLLPATPDRPLATRRTAANDALLPATDCPLATRRAAANDALLPATDTGPMPPVAGTPTNKLPPPVPKPIRLRPHQLALTKRQVAEDKVRNMAAAGVIEPSNSRLGSSWFSSLDLRSRYWQVELVPDARPKTAFTIGQGLWQFRVIPFGLCNAPAVFERLMERVLADVPRSHCVTRLVLLVHGIRRAGLRLNPAKCCLLTRETMFLGHVVSAHGVATDPAKVAAIRDWPNLANVSELRSFLGLASYYRHCIQGYATITSPLHRLTEKGRPFNWDDACTVLYRRDQPSAPTPHCSSIWWGP
ncbi:hypothetical protein SKAU_G00002040 [Synaphobranchus kaupii]|uniref:ribonuclease H n=1 Tax=Synaphobranchus kaupii TaxID=118154 RepID=A0A9Q1G8E5_SYNKA|nr:hypothetical protein SKAU_G00002040 [Synaphobranchus kaupii]